MPRGKRTYKTNKMGSYVERLPKGRGSAAMPNPGQKYLKSPEAPWGTLVPQKRAPKPRKNRRA